MSHLQHMVRRSLTQSLGHLLVYAYGRGAPHHRGKWRIVDGLLRWFGLRVPEHVVTIARGVRFELDLERYIDVHLFYLGYHEHALTRFYEVNLRSGDVFLDFGANIGYFSLLAAKRVLPRGQVHAFEINADDCRRLKRHIEINQCFDVVCINHVAVSDRIGDVKMVVKVTGAGSSHVDAEGKSGTEIVRAITLDRYAKDCGLTNIDFIKLDIEGGELRMLQGARQTLRELRPVMTLELNPRALSRFRASVKQVIDELDNEGYSLYEPCARALRKLVRLPAGDTYLDVVAVPRDRFNVSSDRLPLCLRAPARVE